MGAVCDALVLGLLAAHVRGCRSARLCRDQGEGWVTKRARPRVTVGGRVVQTMRRSCRPDGRVDDLATLSLLRA
eukprot:scaffold122524_cov33-Phaeocystis_antarctica.AAC.1